MQEKQKILAVVGPTASGKTSLAIALARAYGGEVISCDSMQIYRDMDIGTAKPTAAEQAAVPHHLIDILEPDEPFSVMDYVEAASAAIDDVTSRGKLPVLCGGTGLYLDALLRGGLPDTPAADEALRAELYAIADECGADYLHAELAAVDPESAAATHANNVRRVVRALEIYRATGIPKSEWDRRSQTLPARYNAAVIGLTFTDRALLYARIEQRVDAMLDEGLLAETEALRAKDVFLRSPTAAAAIGYKELLPYLEGSCTLEEAVAELKTATRRYAKRQLTWFSAKPYVHWICADDENGMRKSEEIVNNALGIAESAWNML